ncbi:hypothetical protein ACSFCX_10235 [Yokenella regensburgei]|uniref:hypothetical protein n=1 Tax=Yokenella regensburgei TaxID=158877 RepID=UPI003ED908D9
MPENINTSEQSEEYSYIPSAKELRLRLGETRLQRIRFNLAWYALRLIIPELFQPAGVSRTLILLNLSRKETRSFVRQPRAHLYGQEGVPEKDLRLRQQGKLFRY